MRKKPSFITSDPPHVFYSQHNHGVYSEQDFPQTSKLFVQLTPSCSTVLYELFRTVKVTKRCSGTDIARDTHGNS